MNSDNVKGKMDDMKGRVERQAGEWTGDKESQAKGAMDQLKGKAENAVGDVKEAGRDMADKLRRERDEKDSNAA